MNTGVLFTSLFMMGVYCMRNPINEFSEVFMRDNYDDLVDLTERHKFRHPFIVVHEAIAHDSYNIIKQWVLNHEDLDPTQILKHCISENKINCIKAMIDIGADVNESTLNKDTALSIAVQYGHWDFVKRLCEHEDLEISGVVVLYSICNSGDLGVIESCLVNHPDISIKLFACLTISTRKNKLDVIYNLLNNPSIEPPGVGGIEAAFRANDKDVIEVFLQSERFMKDSGCQSCSASNIPQTYRAKQKSESIHNRINDMINSDISDAEYVRYTCNSSPDYYPLTYAFEYEGTQGENNNALNHFYEPVNLDSVACKAIYESRNDNFFGNNEDECVVTYFGKPSSIQAKSTDSNMISKVVLESFLLAKNTQIWVKEAFESTVLVLPEQDGPFFEIKSAWGRSSFVKFIQFVQDNFFNSNNPISQYRRGYPIQVHVVFPIPSEQLILNSLINFGSVMADILYFELIEYTMISRFRYPVAYETLQLVVHSNWGNSKSYILPFRCHGDKELQHNWLKYNALGFRCSETYNDPNLIGFEVRSVMDFESLNYNLRTIHKFLLDMTDTPLQSEISEFVNNCKGKYFVSLNEASDNNIFENFDTLGSQSTRRHVLLGLLNILETDWLCEEVPVICEDFDEDKYKQHLNILAEISKQTGDVDDTTLSLLQDSMKDISPHIYHKLLCLVKRYRT